MASKLELNLSQDVDAALARGAPVVALESTIISHGTIHCIFFATWVLFLNIGPDTTTLVAAR